jgi:hypothetical protein
MIISWFNSTARELFPGGSSGLLPTCYLLLMRASLFDPTAREFFHDGSPSLLSDYPSLTISWFDLTAGVFLHAGSSGLLHIANENLVVQSGST